MRKKLFNYMIIILSLFVFVEVLINKSIVYNSTLYALNVWVHNLIPALFPFFIISDILVNYNITAYIPGIIINFCKYSFNINDNMVAILFLSMLSGFPSNARITRMLYDKGVISLEQANHILLFSHFSNPVFILTTVSIFFFHNKSIGIILLISHYLSNFFVGIMFRNRNNSCYKSSNYVNDNYLNFGTVFVSAIKRSIDTILIVCGVLVTFLILSSIVVDTFNFNSYSASIIKGIFEITIGIEAISKLDLSMRYKIVITSCFLAFGGISVHVQVLSQIADTKIKYIYFFIGRMYQMVFSGIISFVICLFLRV